MDKFTEALLGYEEKKYYDGFSYGSTVKFKRFESLDCSLEYKWEMPMPTGHYPESFYYKWTVDQLLMHCLINRKNKAVA